jgi:hypothetical protein
MLVRSFICVEMVSRNCVLNVSVLCDRIGFSI